MMTLSDIESLVRSNIRALKPYSSARDEFKLEPGRLTVDGRRLTVGDPSVAYSPSTVHRPPSTVHRPPSTVHRLPSTVHHLPYVFLDANENSLGSPLAEDYSRYPDPHQKALKLRLTEREGLAPGSIFLGNGSDEAIDLLLRAFCTPEKDNVILMPPTYGMYAVMANIHGAEARSASLQPDFSPDAAAVRRMTDARSKLLFLCSPNNPTGNHLPEEFILEMLTTFPGIVVVDEAYNDFSGRPSFTKRLAEYPNLVVLKTFSKAWGLAGLRVGMAFAHPYIIAVLNNIKYPYNIGTATIQLVEAALDNAAQVEAKIQLILSEKKRLEKELAGLPCIEKVFPSDANFLLVKTTNAGDLYQYLCQNNMVVRNRSGELHCENCLRITIGAPEENERLLVVLKNYKPL